MLDLANLGPSSDWVDIAYLNEPRTTPGLAAYKKSVYAFGSLKACEICIL